MKKFNPAISFIRVIAMLSIILGHICTEYGINTYQFGGIGVEIFLFISGYLYGNKSIPNYTNWGGYRWKRLIPPLWIAVTICLGITIVLKAPIEWGSLVTYLLCIQGAGNIAFNVEVPILSGMGQTWFLTVLVVCYVLMLTQKRISKVEKGIENRLIIAGIIAFIAQVALCYIGIQIIYILQFFVGYYLSKLDVDGYQNKWVSKKTFAFLTIISIVFAGVRLVANRYIDGTILYDRIIARWSFSIIAIWLIAIQIYICRNKWTEKLVKSRAWMFLDIASYPLFLTHYMFLTGPMKVMDWFKGIPFQILMFVSFTLASAAIILLLTSRKSVIETLK